ncbi:MAG: 3-dehydroquinate synthase [Clostridia bacterium]|nr:3-dehydroquinate synthase [Clostridia bacterium]
MKKLTVSLNKSYDILIGKGLLLECGELIRNTVSSNKAFVISDSNVFEIYGDAVIKNLQSAGFEVGSYCFKAGEQSKTFDTVCRMVNSMAAFKMTRSDVVIALGGGVTGDMAGFAAAVYMRGIKFVQISTSLLSDIDSSVGGKTGCDLENGKNLVGAFHQPSLVIIDTNTLLTLPQRFINDGMAEAIKYGMIALPELFELIQNNELNDILDELIYLCVDCKRKIVERDEFEMGERKLLNFGHTLGHAIEKFYNFEKYSHGEAVAIGMVMITKAAENNGMSAVGTSDKLIKVLNKYSLPTHCDADISELLTIARSDKKCSGKTIDIVVCSDVGTSKTVNIEIDKLGDLICPR